MSEERILTNNPLLAPEKQLSVENRPLSNRIAIGKALFDVAGGFVFIPKTAVGKYAVKDIRRLPLELKNRSQDNVASSLRVAEYSIVDLESDSVDLNAGETLSSKNPILVNIDTGDTTKTIGAVVFKTADSVMKTVLVVNSSSIDVLLFPLAAEKEKVFTTVINNGVVYQVYSDSTPKKVVPSTDDVILEVSSPVKLTCTSLPANLDDASVAREQIPVSDHYSLMALIPSMNDIM